VVNNVSVPAGGTTTATVTNIGGVPAAASVSAVAVNVIANQPAANGHLQLFAAGTTPPVDSTLNYAQGQTTADFETVPVSSSGQITIFSTAATKVIVRLRGWYASAASTVNGPGSSPCPLPPWSTTCPWRRGTTTFRATGANGIPAPANVSAVAVNVNVVANQPAGAGWLQAYPEGDRPVDSTLNFQQGRTTANFEIVPVPADGRISIFSTTAKGARAPPRLVLGRPAIRGRRLGPGGQWSHPSADQPRRDRAEPDHRHRPRPGLVGPGRRDPRRAGRGRRRGLRRLGRRPGPRPGRGHWGQHLVGRHHRGDPRLSRGGRRAGVRRLRERRAARPGRGAARWSATIGGAIQGAPTVADGVVYVGSLSGRVAAVDAATGAVRWTTLIGGNPMFSRGFIPSTRWSPTASCMSPAPTTDGSTPWTRRPARPSGASPPDPR